MIKYCRENLETLVYLEDPAKMVCLDFLVKKEHPALDYQERPDFLDRKVNLDLAAPLVRKENLESLVHLLLLYIFMHTL